MRLHAGRLRSCRLLCLGSLSFLPLRPLSLSSLSADTPGNGPMDHARTLGEVVSFFDSLGDRRAGPLPRSMTSDGASPAASPTPGRCSLRRRRWAALRSADVYTFRPQPLLATFCPLTRLLFSDASGDADNGCACGFPADDSRTSGPPLPLHRTCRCTGWCGELVPLEAAHRDNAEPSHGTYAGSARAQGCLAPRAVDRSMALGAAV